MTGTLAPTKVGNDVRHDVCPLCGSDQIVRVGQLTYAGTCCFSTHTVELSRVPEMWKCRCCLSGFTQNTVAAETAWELYSTGDPGERWSQLAFDRNQVRKVVRTMRKVFGRKGRVLDVGCNTGELLDFAGGLGCETSGVEPSSASRDVLQRKGHRSHATLHEAPDNFDVITAFDVVEHLYDIGGFLTTCRQKLNVNGMLIVHTGAVGSLSARLAGHGWWYAQYPEHIVFPSKPFFEKHSGFAVEKWLPTYASEGYRSSAINLSVGLMRVLLGVLLGRGSYTGLPSIGPDHALVLLRK